MSKAITYKGYAARVEFNVDDDYFVGHIAGIRGVIGFHADTATDLKRAFHDAVDDYLETCELVGKSPQNSYSAKLILRIAPEIHAAAASAPQVSSKEEIEVVLARRLRPGRAGGP